LGDEEFSEDLFPQAFRATIEVGRRLSRVSKVSVGDAGLGFAEIDTASLRFVFIGRIGTACDDAITAW
jgi:hypothetical protein